MKSLSDLLSYVSKTNAQRAKMSALLANLIIHANVPLEIQTVICTSMWDILKNDTDKVMDSEMIKMFDEIIDLVGKRIEKHANVEEGFDIREYMSGVVAKAEKMIDEKMDRINEGNDILNKINLN